MGNKLFMCYVAGSKGTNRVHNTKEQATLEAERLASLPYNKGKKVFVLTDISVHQTLEEEN